MTTSVFFQGRWHDASDRYVVGYETEGGLPPLVCEQHPSLDWPHGDCGGPGCPPEHRARVLRDALREIRLGAQFGDAGMAAWLDQRGIDHRSGDDL